MAAQISNDPPRNLPDHDVPPPAPPAGGGKGPSKETESLIKQMEESTKFSEV